MKDTFNFLYSVSGMVVMEKNLLNWGSTKLAVGEGKAGHLVYLYSISDRRRPNDFTQWILTKHNLCSFNVGFALSWLRLIRHISKCLYC